MKRNLFVALILILVIFVAAILFFIPNQPVQPADREAVNGETLKKQPRLTTGNTRSASRTPASNLLPQVRMTAVEYKIDPFALNRERENPPFEFRGGQMTKGRVIDSRGNILLESNEENWIHGVAVSPDKMKVLVKRANSSGGTSLVLEPSVHREINLPSRPPGDNMFSLSWHWIGPDLLFGVSGIEKIFHEGPHENCCNDDNVARTKFYTFDLLTEQLSEVIMPSAVKQPVVNSVEVMSDGHIHLMHEEPQEGVQQDLGWFKIDDAK